MSDQKSLIVGIDLGTSYSAVACVDEHGDAEIIPNAQGERITPSVILFENSENETVVGQTAKDQSEYMAENVVSFVKREMGRKKEDVRIEENNGVPKPYKFWNKIFSPEELSAIILKKLKNDAEQYLNTQLKDAVITVPAYFNDSERQATKDAGKIAGLNVLHVMNEPTAAAISYGVFKADRPQHVFVFDLGGGTFDVTILKIDINDDEKDIKMIQTNGDHHLGGKDWDDKIIEYCSNQFELEYGLDPLEDIDAKADLRQKAERAKRQLSDRESTKIILNAHGKKLSIDLTREQFESFTSDLLDRCTDLCNIVLEEANLNWQQIDELLLAGGSTRMPMVQKMLKDISGKELHPELVNPDECVALGAATKAKSIGIDNDIKNGLTPSLELMDKIGKVKAKDVTSHKLGIVAVHDDKDIVSEIIPKGTPVPCSKTKTYQTIEDYQPNVLLQIKEGESDDPDLVPTIQEATLPIVQPQPKGNFIDVTFKYSADGILVVIAKDVTNDKDIRVEIKREGNLTSEEVDQVTNLSSKISVTG